MKIEGEGREEMEDSHTNKLKETKRKGKGKMIDLPPVETFNPTLAFYESTQLVEFLILSYLMIVSIETLTIRLL